MATSGNSFVGGPSPKKIKLESKPAPSKEVANYRRLSVKLRRKRTKKIKNKYKGHLTELWFLQNGGNLVEFGAWKRAPPPEYFAFMRGENKKFQLNDSDDEQSGAWKTEVSYF